MEHLKVYFSCSSDEQLTLGSKKIVNLLSTPTSTTSLSTCDTSDLTQDRLFRKFLIQHKESTTSILLLINVTREWKKGIEEKNNKNKAKDKNKNSQTTV